MKNWILFILAGILFSCSDSLVDPDIPLENTEAYITLTVQVPGINAPKTYSGLTEIQENEIKHLDILAFEEIAGEEILSYRVTVTGTDIRNAEGSDDGSKKVIELKVKRQEAPVRLMVIANSYSTLNRMKSEGKLEEGIAKKETISKALTFNGTYWKEDKLSSFEGFPMWGQTAGYITFTSDNNSVKESVNLLRAVAKVDIGADINGDPALGFGSRFKIDKVLIYRASKTGYIVPDLNYLNSDNVVVKPTVWDGVEKEDNYYEFNYIKDDTENAMVRKIYLAESQACESGSENEATCLVIGAYFDGGPLTYYRVDFIDNDNQYLSLLRNHKYLINITSISGNGYEDPNAAANSKYSALVYTITVSDETLNSITYNNEYMLGVSSDVIYLDWKAGSEKELIVSTSYEGKWSATFNHTSFEEWLDMDVKEGEGGKTNGDNGKKTTVKLTMLTQNKWEFLREGTITISAGNLVKEVKVRQRMGSNCFIVNRNGSVEIPAAFANSDGVTRVIFSDVEVEPIILWQEQPGIIQSVERSSVLGLSAIFTVNTGSHFGNAVIGAKKGNEIIWSWHVWVTDFNPERDLRSNNGYIFMDRNLGALGKSGTDAYGLVYQWGRKDPFPHAAMNMYSSGGNPLDFEAQPVTEADNLETAIANPTVFYTSAGAPYYSWQGISTSSNFLWTDADGNKTPYDPCPDGWRVPVSGTEQLSPWYGAALADLVDNKAPGYYPLAGGRMNDTGEPGDVGIRGYVWSASPYSFNAFLFQYGSGVVNPSGAGYRANGYPVRCVKE